MQAVVTIQGKQFLVTDGMTVRVDAMPDEVGKMITLDTVLLTNDGKTTDVKSTAVITATVVAHGLGKKVRVFKHHAKKRYRRTQGARAHYTELLIQSIGDQKAAVKAPPAVVKPTKALKLTKSTKPAKVAKS